MEEQETCSNTLTQFVQALYNDFDFDKALVLAKQVGGECKKDVFLSKFANELQRSAQFLVFDIQGRLNSHVDLKYVAEHTGQTVPESAAFLEGLAKESGLACVIDDAKKTLKIMVVRQDIKGKITEKTVELARRTKEVHEHMEKQRTKK